MLSAELQTNQNPLLSDSILHCLKIYHHRRNMERTDCMISCYKSYRQIIFL